MRNVILASQSPQRRVLFEQLGIPFEQIPADLDERTITDTDLVKRAQLVAEAKVEHVAKLNPDAIIIAADTYIIFNNQALEKPKTLSEAEAMLKQQSGQTLIVVTGLCMVNGVQGNKETQSIITEVVMRELSETEIKKYVANNPVLTWSGGFSPAYPAGAVLVDRINGPFTSFSHGLPMAEVVTFLQKAGAL